MLIRRLIIIIVTTFLILTLGHDTCFAEKYVDNGTVKLTVKQVKYESKPDSDRPCMEIIYEVSNISDSAVWVNMENGYGTWEKPFPFMVEVLKNYNSIHIRLMSIIYPFGVDTYVPVYAKYIRIPPKQSRTFTIVLNSPLQEYFPYGKDSHDRIEIDNIRWITLEVGYYALDLHDYFDKFCCEEASERMHLMKEDDVLYVSNLWARGTREESILIRINKSQN